MYSRTSRGASLSARSSRSGSSSGGLSRGNERPQRRETSRTAWKKRSDLEATLMHTVDRAALLFDSFDGRYSATMNAQPTQQMQRHPHSKRISGGMGSAHLGDPLVLKGLLTSLPATILALNGEGRLVFYNRDTRDLIGVDIATISSLKLLPPVHFPNATIKKRLNPTFLKAIHKAWTSNSPGVYVQGTFQWHPHRQNQVIQFRVGCLMDRQTGEKKGVVCSLEMVDAKFHQPVPYSFQTAAQQQPPQQVYPPTPARIDSGRTNPTDMSSSSSSSSSSSYSSSSALQQARGEQHRRNKILSDLVAMGSRRSRAVLAHTPRVHTGAQQAAVAEATTVLAAAHQEAAQTMRLLFEERLLHSKKEHDEKLERVERDKTSLQAVVADLQKTLRDSQMEVDEAKDLSGKYDKLLEQYMEMQGAVATETKTSEALIAKMEFMEGRMQSLQEQLEQAKIIQNMTYSAGDVYTAPAPMTPGSRNLHISNKVTRQYVDAIDSQYAAVDSELEYWLVSLLDPVEALNYHSLPTPLRSRTGSAVSGSSRSMSPAARSRSSSVALSFAEPDMTSASNYNVSRIAAADKSSKVSDRLQSVTAAGKKNVATDASKGGANKKKQGEVVVNSSEPANPTSAAVRSTKHHSRLSFDSFPHELLVQLAVDTQAAKEADAPDTKEGPEETAKSATTNGEGGKPPMLQQQTSNRTADTHKRAKRVGSTLAVEHTNSSPAPVLTKRQSSLARRNTHDKSPLRRGRSPSQGPERKKSARKARPSNTYDNQHFQSDFAGNLVVKLKEAQEARSEAAGSYLQHYFYEVGPMLSNKLLLANSHLLNTFTFDAFAVQELTHNRVLEWVFLKLLKKYNLFELCDLDETKAGNFIRAVQALYLPNPYHNALHGADVLQSTAMMIESCVWRDQLTSMELLGLLISAAVHDVGHPGVTNHFLVRTKSPLALIYNDRMVLENYHASTAFQILQTEECRMFRSLDEAGFTSMRAFIIELVLATDLGEHAKILGGLKQTFSELSNIATVDAETGKPSAYQMSPPERLQLCVCVLKAADIGHPTRPLQVHLKWSERVVEEFYCQGDREVREFKMSPSPFCDRGSSDKLCGSQIGFISFLAQPMYAVQAKALQNNTWLNQLKKSLGFWQWQNNAEKEKKAELEVERQETTDAAVNDEIMMTRSAKAIFTPLEAAADAYIRLSEEAAEAR